MPEFSARLSYDAVEFVKLLGCTHWFELRPISHRRTNEVHCAFERVLAPSNGPSFPALAIEKFGQE